MWRSLAPWVRVLVVYATARALTTALMLLSSAMAPADGRHGANPPLRAYVVGWDGAWYREIALNGYPTVLPTNDAGQVVENAWAFMPVYPFLARLLAALVPGAGFGSDDVWAVAGAWAWCALLISLLAGYGACFVLYALLRHRLGASAAMWAVALFACNPFALLFQVAYAESLFLLLIFCAILCLEHRRWWFLYPLAIVMAFTRPGELALPLTVALFGIWRLFHRREQPLHRAEVAHILGVGAVGTAAGFAWPVIVTAVTGSATGYLDTELAWRRGWVDGAEGFFPGEGWIHGAQAWAGIWGVPTGLVLALVLVLAVGAVGVFFTPAVRRLSLEARLWCASYLVYVALVVFPQSSAPRLLLPVAILCGAVAAIPLGRFARLTVLLGSIALQFVWLHGTYGIGNTYYLVP